MQNRKLSVKDQILSILDQHKGSCYSGQELAEQIGVSRTAVWKAVNALRKQGLLIEGSTKLGYTMSDHTDILNLTTIEQRLMEPAKSFCHLTVIEETESTNDLLRLQGIAGQAEGMTVIAGRQTAGKGRKGRSFHSPESTGLYMSILLRPQLELRDAVLITTAAAVAAARACEAVNHDLENGEVGIKWVNDLILNDRKIAGILTEGNLSMETGKLDFAVLGIGINISSPSDGWPEELSRIAGSLYEHGAPVDSRNHLAAEFLNQFIPIYQRLPDIEYLQEYRRRSVVIGKEVLVSGAKEPRIAAVKGIDDRCQLIVQYEGQTELCSLNSGEISIRKR